MVAIIDICSNAAMQHMSDVLREVCMPYAVILSCIILSGIIVREQLKYGQIRQSFPLGPPWGAGGMGAVGIS